MRPRSRAGSQEQEWSMEQSSLLNDAYRTLRDPVKRAEHLLALRGVKVAGEERGGAAAMPQEFLEQLRPAVLPTEFYIGLAKSISFGAFIALISCHRGFNSRGGSEGVGQAATQAFVLSFIAILALDFFLSLALNSAHDRIFS